MSVVLPVSSPLFDSDTAFVWATEGAKYAAVNRGSSTGWASSRSLYAHSSKQRIMTLDAIEYMRRFFLAGSARDFGHYGLLASRFRNLLLPQAHGLLAPRTANNGHP